MEVSGSKTLKVDAKGRVFLPRPYLETEEDADGYKKAIASFWLTPGLDGCLWLLDQPEWRRMQRRVRASDIGDKKTRAVHRFLFEHAEKVKPDAQGRVLLPETHRKLAKISGQATVVGVGRRIEIWAPEVYDAYKAEIGPDWIKDLEAILSGEGEPT